MARSNRRSKKKEGGGNDVEREILQGFKGTTGGSTQDTRAWHKGRISECLCAHFAAVVQDRRPKNKRGVGGKGMGTEDERARRRSWMIDALPVSA